MKQSMSMFNDQVPVWLIRKSVLTWIYHLILYTFIHVMNSLALCTVWFQCHNSILLLPKSALKMLFGSGRHLSSLVCNYDPNATG